MQRVRKGDRVRVFVPQHEQVVSHRGVSWTETVPERDEVVTVRRGGTRRFQVETDGSHPHGFGVDVDEVERRGGKVERV